MNRQARSVTACTLAMAGILAVPAEALRTIRRAIRDAVPDVTFVTTMVEASHLIELTSYTWSPDGEYDGVIEKWHLCYQSLEPSDTRVAGRVRPARVILFGAGKTVAESTQSSSEQLREAFTRLLPPLFHPVVPK